jgi:hypothetical protein
MFRRRRRRWRRVALAAAAGLFMWPAVLQFERLPQRLDSLRMLGPVGEPAAQGGGQPRRARRPIRSSAPAPSHGALRESPPAMLEAQPPPATTARLTTEDMGKAIERISFSSSASTSSSGSAGPFSVPILGTADPDPFAPLIPQGPGGPGPNPSVVNPPVVGPPVTTPPGGNPPVVQPQVDPPVIPPGGPGGPLTPPFDFTGPGPGPGDENPPAPAIPEPSAWIELILGAALAGTALRRSRHQRATALRASSSA